MPSASGTVAKTPTTRNDSQQKEDQHDRSDDKSIGEER